MRTGVHFGENTHFGRQQIPFPGRRHAFVPVRYPQAQTGAHDSPRPSGNNRGGLRQGIQDPAGEGSRQGAQTRELVE